MNIEDTLRNMMIAKAGSVKSFAKISDLPYSTVLSILDRGVMNAKVQNVFTICSQLGINPESLGEFENGVISNTVEKMIQLDFYRQERVYRYTSDQLDEQNNVIQFPDRVEVNKELIRGRRMAGGSALHVDDNDARRDVVSSALIPKGADELVEVSGKSMEPLIKDGEEVYIRYQPSVESGEIAVVRIENEGVTCKRVYIENDTVRLKSENEEYEDMLFDFSQITILGKVLI